MTSTATDTSIAKKSSTLLEESLQGGLSTLVASYLDRYFKTLGDTESLPGLYDMIWREVERPLLVKTLQNAKGNQKKAAHILGINRNTLRRKLIEHHIDMAQL